MKDEINAMLEAVWPTSGVECTHVDSERAVAKLVAGERDVRPGGYLSGPAQFAVADSAFWFLVSGALGRVEPMALTSELSIRFLRPAIGDRLMAEATLDRRGSSTVVATVRVWVDDPSKPCSVAQGTYTLPREE